MEVFTEKQKAKVELSLKAFTNLFGEPRISKLPFGGGWVVYYPADTNDYVIVCETIDGLQNWLYGCVQATLLPRFKEGRKS